MTYDFLIDTYATERVKVVSVWSEFTDVAVRPLMQDHAPTIYAYSSLDALLEGEAEGGESGAARRTWPAGD